MCNDRIRTDLALEANESLSKEASSMPGVRVEEYERKQEEVKVTKVSIESKNASKRLEKPIGRYITMETWKLSEPDEGYNREISKILSGEIKGLLDELDRVREVMIIGLGNRMVTADALGPLVVDNLAVNRHLVMEFGRHAISESKEILVSSLEPGVMAKTGMETAEIIKGVVGQVKPDAVIVVDALAARSLRRLNRTIQIADSGIWPGSGVGNHRNALNRETIGVPVIAIGIPTVVDASTIVRDAILKMTEKNENPLQGYFEWNRDMLPELNNMFMTGKDIDALVKRISYTVSEGINMALRGKAYY